jgi:hypothetical protein
MREAILTGHPRPLQAEDYNRASEEILRGLRSLPRLLAVYRTGSISVPGISDLDFVAVVDGTAAVPDIWSDLSETTRHVAAHSPFVVDLATFRRHRWFAHLDPLELVAGRAIEIESTASNEGSILLAAESLLINLLRQVKRITNGRVKVRTALCELHTIRHGLALGKLDESDAPLAFQVAGEVASLRKQWFSETAESNARLSDVLVRAFPALHQALESLAERVGHAGAVQEFPLGAPWANVLLAPSLDRSPPAPRLPRLGVMARSAHLSELQWRLRRRPVEVPHQVIGLVSGASGSTTPAFRKERDELVRSYGRFMAEAAPGYSPIGLAAPFIK